MIRPQTACQSSVREGPGMRFRSRKPYRENTKTGRQNTSRFLQSSSCAGTAEPLSPRVRNSAQNAGPRSVLLSRPHPARLPHRRLHRSARAVEARLGLALSSAGIVAGSCNNPETPILISGPAHRQNIRPCAGHRNKPDPVPGGHKTDTSDYRENRIFIVRMILNPFIHA